MDQQLTEMPPLSKLYVNAAGAAAKQRIMRTAPSVTLPARGVEVRGVRANLSKVTEFAHLMGEPARDVLPSGYIHALAFPVAMSVMVQDDFPLPLLGMIHLHNVVENHRDVNYQEPLRVRSWARNLAGHRSGTQVELVTEVHSDTGDDLLWREVSTYLAKGIYLPGLDKPLGAGSGERAVFDPPVPTAQWRLGVDTGRAYAAVSGDFNPIHLSALTAKALGLRRSIAHGMYAASRVLSDIGTRNSGVFTWEISFDAPMFLPATVQLCISDLVDSQGGWSETNFVAWNARTGRKHFSGAVTAGVPSEI